MSSPKSATLIDRDELLATLEQDIDVSVTGEDNMEAVKRCLQEILDDVKASPVVDAVPVIRCKDCKWYYRGGATCMYWDGENGMRGDDYCSRAERKEE